MTITIRDDEVALIERNDNAKPRFSLIDGMRVERGTKADWDVLHDLHYKAESLPAGPRFWRCVTEDGDLVGIVVFSSVSLLLAPRHQVFPKLKPGQDTNFTNVHRAKFLNNNFRRAARLQGIISKHRSAAEGKFLAERPDLIEQLRQGGQAIADSARGGPTRHNAKKYTGDKPWLNNLLDQ